VFYTQIATADLDQWDYRDIPLTQSAELFNLAKNTQYAIVIAARTNVSFGQLSDTIFVKVTPDDVVRDLRAHSVTTHSVTLTWKAPFKTDPINYKISYGTIKEFRDSGEHPQKLVIPPKVID
ncbi:hypothetical protein CHUAL_009437, partial [Chamberlinius hualienensis]